MTPSSPTRAEFRIDDAGVHVPDAEAPVLVLSVNGDYLWSITPARDGRPVDDGTLVPWPEVLRKFLDGTATMEIADHEGEVLWEHEVALGSGKGEIKIVDPRGYPLCVDKVGHLTRSFAATDQTIRDEILAGTQRALADLREHAGVEAYLNYGALLGAVREGRMLGHDSDTDVCYLSAHTVPADVITESYAVERAMRERGWHLVRMSGGDIKLFLPLSDGRQCQIDVFVAFYVPAARGAGPFFQLGNRSGTLAREAIVPVSTIDLHGHDFPAPADPEAMLAFVYGPHWRVPDPSFKYEDPPAGVRRLDGWLRGFRDDISRWSEFHHARLGSSTPGPTGFAQWVEPQLREGELVADLGAGLGRDGFWFARAGRPVLATEYAQPTVGALRRRSKRAGLASVEADQLILGELRSTLHLGARLARETCSLYARDLVGCLDDEARRQLWLLARMALRTGGFLYLEIIVGEGRAEPDGLVRRLEEKQVRAEIEAAGGVVEHSEVLPGEDILGHPEQVCRMRVAWPVRAGKGIR